MALFSSYYELSYPVSKVLYKNMQQYTKDVAAMIHRFESVLHFFQKTENAQDSFLQSINEDLQDDMTRLYKISSFFQYLKEHAPKGEEVLFQIPKTACSRYILKLCLDKNRLSKLIEAYDGMLSHAERAIGLKEDQTACCNSGLFR